jgi:hypothetical protein
MSTFAVLQTNKKIIVASVFTSLEDGSSGSTLTRLNPDGSLDETFDAGTGPNEAIHQMAWDADGKLLIKGDFTEINGLRRLRIARLNVTPPFKFDAPTRSANGKWDLILGGAPGNVYVLQTSTDLENWRPIRTNSVTGFTLEFEDAEASFPFGFYRARLIEP